MSTKSGVWRRSDKIVTCLCLLGILACAIRDRGLWADPFRAIVD